MSIAHSLESVQFLSDFSESVLAYPIVLSIHLTCIALFGGMILGLIATLINFNGSLNGAWIMISGGVLLFLFIVMQRSLLSSFRLRGAA